MKTLCPLCLLLLVALPAAAEDPPAPEWAREDTRSLDEEVPVVPKATLDAPVPNRLGLRWGERFVVHLTADGRALVREDGESSALKEIPLGGPDPKAQDLGLLELRRLLVLASSDPKARNPDGTSKVRLLVRASGRTRWQIVQWVLVTAAGPRVRMTQAALAVRVAADGGPRPAVIAVPDPVGIRDGSTLSEALPEVEEGAPSPAPAPPAAPESSEAPPKDADEPIRIRLFRRHKEDPALAYTQIRLDGAHEYGLPPGDPLDAGVAEKRDTAFASIAEGLEQVRRERPKAPVQVAAPPPNGGAVPYADAVRLLALLAQHGIPVASLEAPVGPLPSSEGGTFYR
jgi:hypothetical protein